MKMKKFTAPTIAEAMKQIRKELGDDAVILNSKVVVTKKLLGLIQRKHFEVVAGIDTAEQKPSQPTFSFNTPFTPTPQLGALPKQATSYDPIQQDTSISAELKKEIADLKSIMQSMRKQSIQADYPEELVQLMDFLKSQELDEQLITDLSDKLFTLHKNVPMNYIDMVEKTKQLLHEQLRHLPYSGLSYNKKYVHVLGPTGVGKTTTIAKMAARAVLEKKKKIGFITTDTYRIAAIDQLKTYAGLLQAPVEIVYSPTDYEEAIKKLAHLDLIFIDTAGRNYKEQKYVDDIQKLLRFDDISESYLVLSMTAKQKDLEAIIEQFSHLPVGNFIFTKVDETNSIGTMFNLMIKYNKGLAYYTNGQEVPEDIEQPTLDSLLNLFFQGEGK